MTDGTEGMEGRPLLSVRGLTKHFPVMSRGFRRSVLATVKAVDAVSFDLAAGETLGLVGRAAPARRRRPGVSCGRLIRPRDP